ncbi:hypothetical protein [Citrobacter koseri]|uniref:hypothetical protein n=1 Tax=Citrobacter koseri TaxID=545 RepID=UPI001F21D48C|nr:hypothetical protein [Citrobacter koseri]
MTTITKEWLQQTIAEYEASRDEIPFGLDTNSAIELEAFKIALASLEAGSDSNNHPAHGPLSNDRLHRISDILRKAAAQSDGGNIGYAMSDAVKAIDELLAGRKSEPDYIRYDCGCCGWETIEDWRDNDVCPKCNHKPMGKTELFIAPPAPVVPEEATPKNIEMLASARVRNVTFQWGEDERNAAADSWNACRAAMLNGGKS